MNPDIKEQWLAALRSGEYEQGRGTLHRVDNDEYYCLGALCDLAVKAGVAGRVVLEVEDTRSEWFGDPEAIERVEDGTPWLDLRTAGLNDCVLPESVQWWAGLPSENPEVVSPTDGGTSSPAEWNDAGASFQTIATLIEENL